MFLPYLALFAIILALSEVVYYVAEGWWHMWFIRSEAHSTIDLGKIA